MRKLDACLWWGHVLLRGWSRASLATLAYTLFFFLWGFLPWQGLENNDMLECKRTIPTCDLFHELPQEFRAFLEHCRSLSFDGKPDYDHFLALFDNLLSKEVYQGDAAFDWDVAGEKIMKPSCRKKRIVKRGHGCTPSAKRRTG